MENDISSLEELVKSSQAGNNLAFTTLITNIQDELFKIAKLRLKYEDDIEDAVQETIIGAYKHLKKLKHPEYFKTWIIRILINNCNKVYKKTKKEINYTYYNELVSNTTYSTSNDEQIQNLDFYMLIEKLSYKEKITLSLYYFSEFTTKEISKILNESEGTIRSRISRSKLKVKKMYKEVEKI